MGQSNSTEAPDPSEAIELNSPTPEGFGQPSVSAVDSIANNATVTTQPSPPVQYYNGGTGTPVLRDRRNLAISVASQTCCGSTQGHHCSQDPAYGRRGLPPAMAIYGTTPSPPLTPPASVVVTPPRCLPPAPSPPPSGSAAPGCGHWCRACRVRVQVEVQCVAAQENRTPAVSPGRRGIPLTRRVRHKMRSATGSRGEASGGARKKRGSWTAPWTLRLNFKSKLQNSSSSRTPRSSPDPSSGADGCASCVCPGYRPNDHQHGGDLVNSGISSTVGLSQEFPLDDLEEAARVQRAREMAEGVEPPPGFSPPHGHPLPLPYNSMLDLQLLLERSLRLGLGRPRSVATSLTEESLLKQVRHFATGGDGGSSQGRTVHTQVDYIHCLVPDLLAITRCPCYWGKMDRYEAETLLEGRPEGTFLLRDSAQEEYLFSVSFRRYNRSLHARIEQWNHKFSFDSHDPGVFASDTVTGLIEHYKDPACCMFFEPMLTNPLARTFPFPLQHLCRAAICSTTTYDGINHLTLPKSLKNYLKEYHYKQRVRVRRLDH